MSVVDSRGYKVRENASPGYWLVLLLPAAYLISNFHSKKCSTVNNFEYQVITAATCGLCIQFLVFFIFNKLNNLISEFVYYFLPGFITAVIFMCHLKQTMGVATVWGITVTAFCQFVFGKLLTKLPKTFTLGEAGFVAQGFTMFILNSVLRIPLYLQKPPNGTFTEFNAIMITALMILTAFIGFIYTFKCLLNEYVFYILLMGYAVLVSFMPITKDFPIIILIQYITNDRKKIYLFAYYAFLVCLTVLVINWKSDSKASTRSRKLFHILIVLVYIPGVLFYCSFLYLATGVALAFMVLLETIRVAEIRPLAESLKTAFVVFCDEKDSGTIAVTPLYLLVGCSLPLWISPCPCTLTDSIEKSDLLILLSGVLTVGIGDTAASVIGSRFGKCKWSSLNRSVEGTLAYIISVTSFIVAFYYLKLVIIDSISKSVVIMLAVFLSAFVEAFTDQIDNLVLPLIFYSVVSVK